MSNTSLSTAASANSEVSIDKLNSYLDAFGIATKLTAQERTQFIEIAQSFGLNPFKREIYAIKYGTSAAQIIVGYEVYLKRAELSGQFDGVDTIFYAEGNDTVCQVTVHRKDWSRPLIHRVYLSEYNQSSNPLWKQKPKTMLRKVGVSQAYRMAFPCDLGGMPYTSDEIADSVQESTAVVVNEPATEPAQIAKPTPPKLSKEELAKASQDLLDWQNRIDTLVDSAEAYTAHTEELRNLKGIPSKEKVSLFGKFKEVAYEKGYDYNDDTKVFYAAEPAVTTESTESE